LTESRPDDLWLFKGLRYIDFSWKEFLGECILICRETKGGFTLSDIQNLSFDEYQFVLKEAFRLQKQEVGDG